VRSKVYFYGTNFNTDLLSVWFSLQMIITSSEITNVHILTEYLKTS
jgi:hypothetical protein